MLVWILWLSGLLLCIRRWTWTKFSTGNLWPHNKIGYRKIKRKQISSNSLTFFSYFIKTHIKLRNYCWFLLLRSFCLHVWLPATRKCTTYRKFSTFYAISVEWGKKYTRNALFRKLRHLIIRRAFNVNLLWMFALFLL